MDSTEEATINLDREMQRIADEIKNIQNLSRHLTDKCMQIVNRMEPEILAKIVDTKDVLTIMANMSLCITLLDFIENRIYPKDVEVIDSKPKKIRRSKKQ